MAAVWKVAELIAVAGAAFVYREALRLVDGWASRVLAVAPKPADRR